MTGVVPTRRGRDAGIIGAVGVAHLFSHFYQLTLAPLFPLIKTEFGISSVELGLLVSLFFVASAALQTPAGFLVDRYGARPVLLGGLALAALAVTGYAFAPGYPALLALSFVAGAGNSVFHPADYSLLNQTVSPGLIGRAYSIHTLGGHIGYGLAPFVMALLGTWLGWRGAVAVVGLAGIATALAIAAMRAETFAAADAKESHRIEKIDRASVSVLLSPAILAFFLFFVIMAMGMIGLQNFAPLALVNGYGMSLVSASGVLSGLLFAAPVGVFAGGIVADRSRRHDLLAGGCVTAAGLLILSAVAFEATILPAFVVAGFLFGLALPSRDMVIRASTPAGASGRVFGFVYGGLDAGSAVTPVLYGWFIDLERPFLVFASSGALLMACALVLLSTAALMRRAGRRAEEATP